MEKMTEEQKIFLDNYLNGLPKPKPKPKPKSGFWYKVRLYLEWAAKSYLRSQQIRYME